MPMLCCYARRRRHRRRTTSDSKSPVDSQCRRNAMFSLMLARLDEFESLTPLMITPSVSSSASEIVTAARVPEYQLEAPQSSSRRPRLLSLPQLASQQSQDERPRQEEQSKFCSDSHRRLQLVNAEERDAIKHQVFVDNDNGVKSKSKAQLKYTQRRQQFVCRIDDSNQKNDSPASCIPLCTTSKSPHQILTTVNSKNPAAANNQAIIIRSPSSAPVISPQRAAVRVLTSTAGGGGGGGPGPGSGSATGGLSLGLGSFSSLSQTSPPPPRRTPTGKTLIVPLATNKGRAPLAPLLGTAAAAAAAADGRLTSQSSLDNATSKSFTTIPEDDDELKYHSSSSSTDAAASNDGVLHTQTTLANRSTNRFYDSADLISIDRTSISCAESRPFHYNCLSGVSLPPSAPEFEIPVPSYAPPPPPAQTALSDPALYRPSLFIRSPKSISRREFLTMTTAAVAATADSSNNSSSQMSGQTRTRKSPSGDSLNSFSSPADSSSYGTQSPLDTSGSLSDSFYLASENGEANTDLKLRLYLSDSGVQQRIGCDASTAAAPELELSAMDADAQSQRKYLLHRIEEESEHAEEILVKDNNDIGLANSRTFDSIASELSCIAHIDSERNILIPRSISQQFELLNEK